VPELSDKSGLIYAKNTFNLEDFNIELDVSIHNKQSSSFPQGHLRIYLLRDNPMKSSNDFAHGLDNMYDGFQLHIFEGSKRNTNKELGT